LAALHKQGCGFWVTRADFSQPLTNQATNQSINQSIEQAAQPIPIITSKQ
jgi:hypothetical protein